MADQYDPPTGGDAAAPGQPDGAYQGPPASYPQSGGWPGYGYPPSEQPTYAQPTYAQPTYVQPSFDQPPYPSAGYTAPVPQEYAWSGPGADQGWNYAPAPPPVVPPGTSNRRGLLIAAAIIAIVIVVAAVVNLSRRNNTASDNTFVIPTYTGLAPFPFPSTTPSLPNGGGLFGNDPDGSPIPAVFCPVVRDEKSHLSYRCIDDGLAQDGSDNYLGLRISLNKLVEEGWVVSEGSGNPESVVATTSPTAVAFPRAPMAPSASPTAPSASPTAPSASPTAQDIQSVVEDRTQRALQRAYGDNPSSKVLSQGPREVAGVTGYELTLEITMNPVYRAHRNPPLKTKNERLWVVGVPTQAGVSIFMLSIPDLRKDLWPKAEDTIDSISII